MVKINTDHLKELAETMDLIAQHQLDKASQIYYCVVKSVNNNQCTIIFNNKQYTVPYYGGKPAPNKTYAIFLPHNNMNESFVIGDGKDGGGGGSGSGIAIQPDPPIDGELVWIDTDDPGTTHIIPEIDDDNVSASDTWSSQKIRDFIYPVGSIYMSVNSISPSTIFGGTWEQLEDTFLLGAGTNHAAGTTGGEETHTLTSQELPSSMGRFAAMSYPGDGYTDGIFSKTSQTKDTAWTGGSKYGTTQFSAAGGGRAHNNMPPYLAVYIWKRTA